jgi:Iron-containing redox enzyme
MTTPACGSGRAPLPAPRGPITTALFAALRSVPGRHEDLALAPDAVDDADDEDLQLALYCCYELHYGGFPDVAATWEWGAPVLALRRRMEGRFEGALRRSVPSDEEPARPLRPADVVGALWRLAGGGDGPSLSAWVERHARRHHLTELAKHRSAYQLKEADPHTWGIPRLQGRAKAAMVAIQWGEYGEGHAARSHAALFATTMAALGLVPSHNAYLAEVPASTLATVNAISLFGLHHRLRGALVGHLALFEMTSVGPMSRYASAIDRLGLPPAARAFYDVHVAADEVHQHLAADELVGGLLEAEPWLAADVLFGARVLAALEARVTGSVLAAWREGRTSLR